MTATKTLPLWIGVLPEKLPVVILVKKSPHFMAT